MRPTSFDQGRRSFLALGGAAAGAAMLGSPARAAQSAGRGFFAGHGLPIGIQLYTLGQELAQDVDGGLKALSAMGYRTVELAGFLGRTPAELRASLDRAGLTCPAAHIPGRGRGPDDGLNGDLARLADNLKTVGVVHAVMPSHYAPDRLLRPQPGEAQADFSRRARAALTADDWKMNADFLNEKGAVLKRSGIATGYHNHAYEFAPIGNTNGFEILLAETDPSIVSFEVDIGWVAAAGVDPYDLLARHKGRFTLMHVKDLKGPITPGVLNPMRPTEVGSGVLDWRKLLAAAYAAGVRGYFVEQEPPFERPRLEAAKISHDFLARVTA